MIQYEFQVTGQFIYLETMPDTYTRKLRIQVFVKYGSYSRTTWKTFTYH